MLPLALPCLASLWYLPFLIAAPTARARVVDRIAGFANIVETEVSARRMTAPRTLRAFERFYALPIALRVENR